MVDVFTLKIAVTCQEEYRTLRKRRTNEHAGPLGDTHMFDASSVAADNWNAEGDDHGLRGNTDGTRCGRVQAESFANDAIHIG